MDSDGQPDRSALAEDRTGLAEGRTRTAMASIGIATFLIVAIWWLA